VTLAERFGQNLARARAEAGLSQEEVGVRASLHRTAVGQLERGERAPRVETLIKLAGALGVDPAVLLEGLSWHPGEMRVGHFEAESPR
jgi:transcriptional regulator with XRE-family HTH domain